MFDSIFETQSNGFIIFYTQSGNSSSRLLIGHTNSSHKSRIAVAVAGVKQIKALLGKVKPAFLVEIFCVILADYFLKLFLKRGDNLMKWFGSGGKVIRTVDTLFVEVNMNMGEPLVVFFDALL